MRAFAMFSRARYAQYMGNRTLKDLTSDPVLSTLAGKPEWARVSPDVAAGLLYISRDELDEMWREKVIPPVWTEHKGKRLYTLGELQRYIEGEEARTRDRIMAARSGEPLVAPRTTVPVQASTTGPLSAKKLRAAGLGEPLMKGGRRRASTLTQFDAFVSVADTAEAWPFAIIPVPGKNFGRPVPLASAMAQITASGHEDDLIDAGFIWMTLWDYGAALRNFAESAAAAADANERLAAVSAAQANDTGKGRDRSRS